MNMLPSVAIKGGNLPLVIIRPLRNPTASPVNNPPTTARGTLTPRANNMAVAKPDRPITEPTERSMPAVMITMHCPKALMAIHEKARKMLKMLVLVRKVSVYKDRKTPMASRIRTMPNSCRPTILRQVIPRGRIKVSVLPLCAGFTLLMPLLLSLAH